MVIPWRRIVRHDGEWFERRRLVIRHCLAHIHAVVGSAQRDSHRTERLAMQLVALVLVALVVYPLLAGFLAMRNESFRAALNEDRRAFDQALTLYRQEYGTFPTGGNGLAELARVERAANRGIRINLTDPWGNPYVYQTYDNGQGCEVTSLGADGVTGGRGPDRDRTLYYWWYPETTQVVVVDSL